MSSLRNRAERAHAENCMLQFLVEWCDEAPYMEAKGMDLGAAYLKFFQARNQLAYVNRNIKSAVLLQDAALYKMLTECGFLKTTRTEAGPKGGRRQVVYFLGVGLKDSPPLEESVQRINLAIQQAAAEKQKLAQEERRSRKQEEYTAHDEVYVKQPSAPAYVTIDGATYERYLIATVKAIKPFKKFNSEEMLSYIVTFHNGQIGHKFISEKEGVGLLKQLGQEIKESVV